MTNRTWEEVTVDEEQTGVRVQDVIGDIRDIEPDQYGIKDLEFENPIPDAVRAHVADDEDGITAWLIRGNATPLAPGGVTATWETEVFHIVDTQRAPRVSPNGREEL